MSLFYQPDIAAGVLNLSAEESRHAVKVLRLRPGDVIELTDGKGFFYAGRIGVADQAKCSFVITGTKEMTARDYSIHIALAPTKNPDRTEWFVEKCVELGVDEITFLLTKNSERKSVNMERMQKLAVSAMKQAGQATMPRLHASASMGEVTAKVADQKFIAFVDNENPDHLMKKAKPGKSSLLLIGPEGDFTGEELQLCLSHGFLKVSLGSSRLRTETAGITGCVILNAINQVKKI